MSAVIEHLERDRLAAVKERDELRAEVERVEAEAASYRRVLVAVRDAMKATGQEPDGDDDPRRPLASLVWRVLKEKDAGADLLAEVERLKAEQASWERAGVDALRDVVAENELLGGEFERLRAERDEAYDREAKAFDALAKEQNRAGKAGAEVERLRGLIRDVEWDAGGYIMSDPLCLWCGCLRDAGHAPDCPAFSARGEVRR